jgi:hypothetical protein
MPRPATHDDLTQWAREADTLVEIHAERLQDFPEVATAFFAAAYMSTSGQGLVFKDGKLSRPKTEAELDKLLAEAQDAWDTENERYAAAILHPGDQKFKPQYIRNTVDRFAKQEKYQAVNWPAEPDTAF